MPFWQHFWFGVNVPVSCPLCDCAKRPATAQQLGCIMWKLTFFETMEVALHVVLTHCVTQCCKCALQPASQDGAALAQGGDCNADVAAVDLC